MSVIKLLILLHARTLKLRHILSGLTYIRVSELASSDSDCKSNNLAGTHPASVHNHRKLDNKVSRVLAKLSLIHI